MHSHAILPRNKISVRLARFEPTTFSGVSLWDGARAMWKYDENFYEPTNRVLILGVSIIPASRFFDPGRRHRSAHAIVLF